MESLRESMVTSFALISAAWTAGHARRFLRDMEFTHVVVLRVEPGKSFYYLYARGDERFTRLKAAHAEQTVHDALNLHEYESVAALPADGPVGDTMVRAVVLDADQIVVGFRDPNGWFECSDRSNDADETTGPVPFAAYPDLAAPDRVDPGQTFDLHVGFSARPNRRLRQADRLAIPDARPEEWCLVFPAADGVDFEPKSANLPVRMDARATFRCTARAAAGETTLKAYYVFRNQFLGVGSLRVAVGPAESRPGGTGPAGTPPQPALISPALANRVDITVTVDHLPLDGRLQWSWTAPTPTIETPAPLSIKFVANAAQSAAGFVKDLADVEFTGPLAARVLASCGDDVAALVPPQLFADLRRVFDAVGRPPNLLLVTNETLVPWELARVSDVFDAAAEPYLAAQTCIGRWLSDHPVAAPPAAGVAVHTATAVAADYATRPLEESLREQKHLVETWKFASLEADKTDLMAYLVKAQQRPGHLIHFAVHGMSDPMANSQSLILQGGQFLPARALAGGRPSPFTFVFLNACQVGTPGVDFGQAAGFPGHFVRTGVAGFVAPLWDVNDCLSREAAERFYRAVLADGKTVGEALRAERTRYTAADSTTPLAYVYYGHPALRLNYPPHAEASDDGHHDQT